VHPGVLGLIVSIDGIEPIAKFEPMPIRAVQTAASTLRLADLSRLALHDHFVESGQARNTFAQHGIRVVIRSFAKQC
jgi:hypothetical protein